MFLLHCTSDCFNWMWIDLNPALHVHCRWKKHLSMAAAVLVLFVRRSIDLSPSLRYRSRWAAGPHTFSPLLHTQWERCSEQLYLPMLTYNGHDPHNHSSTNYTDTHSGELPQDMGFRLWREYFRFHWFGLRRLTLVLNVSQLRFLSCTKKNWCGKLKQKILLIIAYSRKTFTVVRLK